MKVLAASAILAAAIVAHALLTQERYEAHLATSGAIVLLDKHSGTSRICLINTVIGEVTGCSIGYRSIQN
jgi:hypothetical protein